MKEKTSSKSKVADIRKDYKQKFGFNMPERAGIKTKKGLDEGVIREISTSKNEPEWMLEYRLKLGCGSKPNRL
jgi:hypothetical protein